MGDATLGDSDPGGGGTDRLTVVMVADVPAADVASFQSYEARVLPLLRSHGGRLERRLRSTDQRFEAHLISFAANAGYQAYLADPNRVEARGILAGRGVAQRVVVVHDVPVADGVGGQGGSRSRKEPG